MPTKFEDIINDMVNISVGAAAVAAEKTQAVLGDLGSKGEEVRRDHGTPDFARSMSDIFERAGGAFSDATERLNEGGNALAERVLDELIIARVRPMSATERTAFMAHVRELVERADDAVPVDPKTVSVEVDVEADATAADASDSSAGESACA